MGRLGHLDGVEQGVLEGPKTTFEFSGGGQLKKTVFGLLDLLVGGLVDFGTEGVIDDVLAKGDELALEIEIMEEAAIFAGVYDGGRRGGKVGEISRTADVEQAFVLFEQNFQGHRVGDLATLNEACASLEDAPVLGHEKVLRLQEIGNLLIRPVVDEDGAQQGFFGLDVVGLRAENRTADIVVG